MSKLNLGFSQFGFPQPWSPSAFTVLLLHQSLLVVLAWIDMYTDGVCMLKVDDDIAMEMDKCAVEDIHIPMSMHHTLSAYMYCIPAGTY